MVTIQVCPLCLAQIAGPWEAHVCREPLAPEDASQPVLRAIAEQASGWLVYIESTQGKTPRDCAELQQLRRGLCEIRKQALNASMGLPTSPEVRPP